MTKNLQNGGSEKKSLLCERMIDALSAEKNTIFS